MFIVCCNLIRQVPGNSVLAGAAEVRISIECWTASDIAIDISIEESEVTVSESREIGLEVNSERPILNTRGRPVGYEWWNPHLTYLHAAR